MAVEVEAFDGSVLDRAVHPLDLAVGPRMIGFGVAVLDPVGFTDHVESHLPGVDGVSGPGPLGELDAVIGQDRVDPVRNHRQQVFQELPRRPPVGLFDELGDRELAGLACPLKSSLIALVKFFDLCLSVRRVHGSLRGRPRWIAACWRRIVGST